MPPRAMLYYVDIHVDIYILDNYCALKNCNVSNTGCAHEQANAVVARRLANTTNTRGSEGAEANAIALQNKRGRGVREFHFKIRDL